MIKAKKLTREAFAPYGEFCDLLSQGEENQSAFFPDRITWQPLAEVGMSVGYACACEMRIPWYEYHAGTSETRLPLDADMVIYVGKKCVEPDPEELEAFIVPKGTLVKLYPGTVHGRQFPYGADSVHVLILCEAATWENDARTWHLEPGTGPLIVIEENQ